MLDPFLPENPEHVARLKAMQEDIHASFIDLVKSRRGAKLTAPEQELFSGEYWAAKKGIELGLVDRIGDLRSFLRERFGDKVETPLMSAGRCLVRARAPGVDAGIDRLLDRPGLADDLVSALEARAIWARYGPLSRRGMPPVILWALGAVGASGDRALARQGSAPHQRRAASRRQPTPVDETRIGAQTRTRPDRLVSTGRNERACPAPRREGPAAEAEHVTCGARLERPGR